MKFATTEWFEEVPGEPRKEIRFFDIQSNCYINYSFKDAEKKVKHDSSYYDRLNDIIYVYNDDDGLIVATIPRSHASKIKAGPYAMTRPEPFFDRIVRQDRECNKGIVGMAEELVTMCQEIADDETIKVPECITIDDQDEDTQTHEVIVIDE